MSITDRSGFGGWHGLRISFSVIVLLAGLNVLISAASAEVTGTWVFECDNQQRYVARAENDTLWLFSAGGTRQLSGPVQAGASQLYRNEQALLRIEGQQATISERGHPTTECRNNRHAAIWEHAKLDGADFRAVGNEPGWHLVIHANTSMVLVTDYGSTRIEQPLPPAQTDHAAKTTYWVGERFELRTIGTPCIDSMSGERFAVTVSVELDDRVLHGCGKALH